MTNTFYFSFGSFFPPLQTEAKMGASRFRVLCVPLRRREKVNKRELDNQTFYHYNKQTKLFDKFLGAWASYCDGTQEDAANMILHYMAKQFPQCYVKNFEAATALNEKANKRSSFGGSTELPPNFVSHDGTNDVKWNTKYSELVEVSLSTYFWVFCVAALSLSSSSAHAVISLGLLLFSTREKMETAKCTAKRTLGDGSVTNAVPDHFRSKFLPIDEFNCSINWDFHGVADQRVGQCHRPVAIPYRIVPWRPRSCIRI
jgi:hypothetical protein